MTKGKIDNHLWELCTTWACHRIVSYAPGICMCDSETQLRNPVLKAIWVLPAPAHIALWPRASEACGWAAAHRLGALPWWDSRARNYCITDVNKLKLIQSILLPLTSEQSVTSSPKTSHAYMSPLHHTPFQSPDTNSSYCFSSQSGQCSFLLTCTIFSSHLEKSW